MSRTATSFIDDRIRYPLETHRALREFARSKPWQGTQKERVEKFEALHAKLCETYGLATKLKFVQGDERTSVYSHYKRKSDTIVIMGRLSVVSYLHLFAYAIDCSGAEVVRWSVNLFKHRFPISFSRCGFVGHLLVRKPELTNYHDTGVGRVDFTAAVD